MRVGIILHLLFAAMACSSVTAHSASCRGIETLYDSRSGIAEILRYTDIAIGEPWEPASMRDRASGYAQAKFRATQTSTGIRIERWDDRALANPVRYASLDGRSQFQRIVGSLTITATFVCQ